MRKVVKVYKYDLWATLFMSSAVILTGIKFLTPKYFDILIATIIIFLGVYILWVSPMKISIDREALHIASAFMFPKKIRWENILSIKTIIFLRTPNLIIEFLKEGKRKKINIPSVIIGYRELTKEIVEKAYNANIDNKTMFFLKGEIKYSEVSSRVVRIFCGGVILLFFIFCLYGWL